MAATGTQLYRGGRIRAMDDRVRGDATALVVRDGRVVACGSDDDMKSAAGAVATVVELDGATVLPGFVDTHPHLFHFSLLEYPLVKLWDAANYDDIVRRIRERAAATPAGQWIMATPVGEPH
jgi:predicted amidohydrolase YtcJ